MVNYLKGLNNSFCPVCNSYDVWGEEDWNFCPNCGRVLKKEKQRVYVVKCQNGSAEPVVYVFDNRASAFKCVDVFQKMYERVWCDGAPVYLGFEE